ncbi:MAG: hypothetical protein HQL91_02185 [Magnetococcales bacterium]|nr:hypothetical protein [Magnetococcales bacterium]
MKTIVTCHHCHSRFKALTDHVPAHGRPAPCPLCGEKIILWKPDDYYPEHFSNEVAVFLLHCKQRIPAADAKTELAHLDALETWLKGHHKTLANATTHDIENFLEEIRLGRSQREADENQTTFAHFYDVLIQKRWITLHPLGHLANTVATPAPAAAIHPSTPHTRLRWGRLVVILLVVDLLASGVIWVLAPPWSPFGAAPTLLQSGGDEKNPPAKIESAREAMVPSSRIDPVREAARLQEAELDRWAQEVVQRAHYIRAADRAIQEIRQEKEKQRSTQEVLKPTQQTVAPKETKRCLSGNCRDGTGRFRFDNGDEYQGNWRGGQRHGTGVYTYINGEKYSGSWRQDRMEGQGSYTYLDGSRYEGEWHANQRHGKGTLIQANGDKYVGEWRHDKRFGQGTRHLMFADHLAKQRQAAELEEQRALAEQEQVRQEAEKRQAIEQAILQGKSGCIEGNCQNGQGVYLYPSGDTYSGGWVNGNRQGEGTYQFSSGDRYSGEWQNNQKHGQGSYIFASGQRYDGEWRFNKKHGVGTITHTNGLRLRGQWENGVPIDQ